MTKGSARRAPTSIAAPFIDAVNRSPAPQARSALAALAAFALLAAAHTWPLVSNPAHLSRFVPAELWQNITP